MLEEVEIRETKVWVAKVSNVWYKSDISSKSYVSVLIVLLFLTGIGGVGVVSGGAVSGSSTRNPQLSYSARVRNILIMKQCVFSALVKKMITKKDHSPSLHTYTQLVYHNQFCTKFNLHNTPTYSSMTLH